MIPCKHCNTLNSLDSTFCKRCGAGMPEDEVTAAKAKLEKLVEEGVHALNLGRIEEAMAVADMAAASDPSMTAAFSLKASAHERKGEIAEALEAAERVVELNPDSELDKIKRNQLRAALGASALQNRPPSRMVAGVAALSVAAIVLCAAVLTAKYINRPAPQPRVVMNNQLPRDYVDPTYSDPRLSAGGTAGSQVPVQNPPASTDQATPPSSSPNLTKAPPTQDESGDNSSDQDSSQQTLPPANHRNAGDPAPNAEKNDFNIQPITPHVPGNLGQNSTPPTPPSNSSKNEGDVVQPEIPANNNTVAQTPPRDPGEIDIRIHDNGSGAHPKSGSSDGDPKDTGKIFMRMGNDYFQTGNYSGAASSLEKAVSSGADPVNANYRLAQSYNSLGKRSEAIEAYKRTITACSNSLNAGKGNSAKLRATRDAAETALKQLQGG